MDIWNAVEEIAAGFGCRLLAGVTIAPGRYYADWDGPPQPPADQISSVNTGGLDIGIDSLRRREIRRRIESFESGKLAEISRPMPAT